VVFKRIFSYVVFDILTLLLDFKEFFLEFYPSFLSHYLFAFGALLLLRENCHPEFVFLVLDARKFEDCLGK